MNITFVSADETIRMSFGVDPWSATTDLTKIEKELGKDLTDIIQKVLDVAFNVTSTTFTRGPKDAYVVSYSWEMQPIIGGSISKDNSVKSISVHVGDSDHNLYEFEDVEDRDVDAMITWLRKEHKVYYTPNDELLNEKKKWATKAAEQQKKIDSYEATLSKITDIMEPEYAGPTWSETWDDLVERIKRMKEKVESLKVESADWMNSFTNAQDSRSAFCKKLKEELNVDYRYPGSFPKMEEDILAEAVRLKKESEDLRKQLEARDVRIETLTKLNTVLCEDKQKIIDTTRALMEFRKEVIKRAGVNEAERSDNYILKSLDIKLDHSASSRFIDKVYELAGCGRYSYTLEEAIEHLEAGLDDARGLSLKIEELEEELKDAKEMENWLIENNRALVMERDCYRDKCEELEQDINEWQDWFDDICEELDTPARDFATVLNELKRICTELDNLAEFKVKLAGVIKLPEDKKDTATTEDYISSFEHTKKEWQKMEIKLKNYETEIRLLNASNGAMYALRTLHDSIVGIPYDFDDPPQILVARIIDRFNHDKNHGYRYLKRMRRLEQKIEDIKDICDGNSDAMNIIGE